MLDSLDFNHRLIFYFLCYTTFMIQIARFADALTKINIGWSTSPETYIWCTVDNLILNPNWLSVITWLCSTCCVGWSRTVVSNISELRMRIGR